MNFMRSYEKIARILRTDKDILRVIDKRMHEIVASRRDGHNNHNNILDRICEENDSRIESSLNILGVSERGARDIYSALIERIREDDIRLARLIHKESSGGPSGFQNMLNVAKEISGVAKGKFLKLEKAKELILKNPPNNILRFLGYKNAQELLEKEDIYEIFAGLRFMEDGKWLNDVFFKPYEELTPDDFEERDIRAKVLSDKWVVAAEQFLKKKYHNLSHLKELGFVFVIPIEVNVPGATLRDFSLSLHYLHEVKFYSDLFEKYAALPDFANKFTAGLRGDVIDVRPGDDELGKTWMIIQRYLAKDDEYDWRLFYPHVNPEAVHWAKAENDMSALSKRFGLGFEFWEGLGPVGNFFKEESGAEVLVSFNFLDTAMSLFQEKEMVKYLYHHQEAMWNKVFSSFFGEEKMERMIIENFDRGIINLT
ncbi:hypothetical protein L6251_03390 [Candidatus Parcubacteria bacterium]|nr:hypothetical protein [Patescibacteria group bacterium]MCG2699433.1 hypothetical protein [Candidatus Parcubacteria bacterium]